MSKKLSAEKVLRKTASRRSVFASVAVPIFAFAGVVGAGFVSAPDVSEEPMKFESRVAPDADPADTKKPSAEKQESPALSVKEKPKEAPVKKSTSSDNGDHKSKAVSEKRGSAPSEGTQTKKKSYPANTKSSGQGGSCKASYYWQGQMTANGERFNTNDFTAAHKSLPFNSHVQVTNKANGKSVTVRINDRGPYISGRCLDLSTAAMKQIGGTGAGVVSVSWKVL